MSAKKKNALGRGLGALLEDTPSEKSLLSRKHFPSTSNISEIKLEYIEVNPYQPRMHFDQEALNELAESIKTQGIIQPITVRKLAKDKYQLIAGERRMQASKLANLNTIASYVRTANDQQMLEMALIENIQRENLNSIEIALSYQRLLSECNLKQEQLGARVGKNRTTVNNYLRLLKLPPDIQASLRDKKISMGHARAIVNIENIDTQLDVFKKIIAEDLSVRKVESLVRNLGVIKPNPTGKTVVPNPEVVKIESHLSSHFGTKVAIRSDNNNKGEIKIPFTSSDELNRILDLLKY